MDSSQLSNISQRIQQAKKYQHLSLETIERIVQWAASRYKTKEVEKQAKKKLHQVFGAYFSAGEKGALEKRLGGRGGKKRGKGGITNDEQGITSGEVGEGEKRGEERGGMTNDEQGITSGEVGKGEKRGEERGGMTNDEQGITSGEVGEGEKRGEERGGMTNDEQGITSGEVGEGEKRGEERGGMTNDEQGITSGEVGEGEKRGEERGGMTNDEQGITSGEVGEEETVDWEGLMELHASSRERVGIVPYYYKKIFEVAERPARVVDLACGLNPFSYPWLAEALPGIAYQGYDIDLHTTARMNRFFEELGLPAAVGYNDLFISVPPHGASDTVMLLKTLPCLEQQEKGISAQLLAQMNCDQLIISFPAKSLGGKEKGMVESYRGFLEGLLLESSYGVKGVVAFDTETVYILNKD